MLVRTPVPRQLEELLDPTWLTDALADTAAGERVVAVEQADSVRTLAEKVRFTVTFERPGGERRVEPYCVKGHFDDSPNTLMPETRFYRELRPLLDVRTPRAHYTGIDEAPIEPPVYPVHGIVQVHGRPAGQVLVVFHPRGHAPSDDDAIAGRSYAKTDTDGNYWLTTREPRNGAPIGTYAITLVWPPSESEEAPGLNDKLGGRYADPDSSPFRFDVRAGENLVPAIELP